MLKPMIECPAVGRVCSARVGPHSPLTPPQNYPPDWERWATPTLPNRAGNPASTFMSIQAFLRRTHPPYGWPDVGRVCSARVGAHSPLTPPQNYPPDWERRATPTLPNQAGNPAVTFMSIRAFFCAGHTRPTVGLPITNIAQKTHEDLSLAGAPALSEDVFSTSTSQTKRPFLSLGRGTLFRTRSCQPSQSAKYPGAV
jgi:hypothetical protein